MGPAFSAFSLQPVQEAAEGIFFALRRGGQRGGQCTPDPGQSGPGPGNVCLLAFFIQIRRLTQVHPGINIVPIDYDLSATKVNQENRIKLMLAVAKERLNAPVEAQPLTAEQLAGGAPQVGATV